MSDENSNFSATSCVIKRRTISFTEKIGKFELREFNDIDVNGSVIVEGFPGNALTPVIVANFLADQLDLPLVGEIYSNEIPPRAVIVSGQPSCSIRILGNRDVVVFLSEFGIGDPELVSSLVALMMSFAKRHSCSAFFTVEGIDYNVIARLLLEVKRDEKAKQLEEKKDSTVTKSRRASQVELTEDEKEEFERQAKKQIFYLTNEIEHDEKLRSLKAIAFRNGIIDNITGALVTIMPTCEMKATALLSATDVRFPDAFSAVQIVKLLAEFIELKVSKQRPYKQEGDENKEKSSVSENKNDDNEKGSRLNRIDLRPLEKQAKKLEQTINRLKNEISESTKEQAPSSMYI